jgi:TIR domain
MKEIFLNFRTGDQDIAAPFLHDQLASWFGWDAVFFSSRSIPPGADFPDSLATHAAGCRVLLALVGPQWLTMPGADGHPRLADPGDWVRREIAIALAAGRQVVPVLVANAPRLTEHDSLPADIAPLARIHHLQLRRGDLIADLEAMRDTLTSLIPGLRVRPQDDAAGGVRVSATAGRVAPGGQLTGIRVRELVSEDGSLSDITGSAKVHADILEGEAQAIDVWRWYRRSGPATAGDDPEAWGNLADHDRAAPGPPELPA